jgi:hypothetical protein
VLDSMVFASEASATAAQGEPCSLLDAFWEEQTARSAYAGRGSIFNLSCELEDDSKLFLNAGEERVYTPYWHCGYFRNTIVVWRGNASERSVKHPI